MISLLPASQAVLQTQLGHDSFFSLGPPLAKPRKVFETRSPRNVQASIPWVWQGPAVSQPGFGLRLLPLRFPTSLSAQFFNIIYTFFFLHKINPKVGSDHTILEAWPSLCERHGLGSDSGEWALAWEGDLLPLKALWAQTAWIRGFSADGDTWGLSDLCLQKDPVSPFQASATRFKNTLPWG